MKRKICTALAILLTLTAVLAGCGGTGAGDTSVTEVAAEEITPSEAEEPEAAEPAEEPAAEPTPEPTPVPEEKGKEVPEGMYLSELSGEPISEELRSQRPIAVMVDNELTSLPHYGTTQGDVVYELMNSTANNRITRLMVMVKDWENIPQLGNIRSTRPTNILLAAEWNAVLCHDGGPYYIDYYFQQPWTDHFSGTFSRVPNGKSREFTEYIVSGDLDADFSYSNYSKEYNEYYTLGDEPHFNFVDWGLEVKLSDIYPDVYSATDISVPFPHNGSNLKYNEETGTYDYYEYGNIYQDAQDGTVMSFKNVILQCCSFTQLDQNGYLVYNCIAPRAPALYITNGQSKFVYWGKDSECEPTRFTDDNGQEIKMNTGKTYIALVPEDAWDQITLENKQ